VPLSFVLTIASYTPRCWSRWRALRPRAAARDREPRGPCGRRGDRREADLRVAARPRARATARPSPDRARGRYPRTRGSRRRQVLPL